MEKLLKIEEFLDNEKKILEVYEKVLSPLLEKRKSQEQEYPLLSQLRLVELSLQGPPKQKAQSARKGSTSITTSNSTPKVGIKRKRKISEGERQAKERFESELDEAGDNSEAEEKRKRLREATKKKNEEETKKKKEEEALNLIKSLNKLPEERGGPPSSVERTKTDSTQNF
jgi:hypothetical protein